MLGVTKGVISAEALDRFIVTKPVIEDLKSGDSVEVISGPFRGLKARITNVDKLKEEVTIELLKKGSLPFQLPFMLIT